jgi:enoyl-CoA hydratase/carnithine racemase
MSFETLLTGKKDQIGTISLNRPKQFNTFSTKMAEELNEALIQMEGDEEIRVVIVKGEGKAFSTGIDVSEFEGKTASEYHAWINLMNEMNMTIASMGKPVIASVHGFAVANGAGLLAAADFAIVAEGTKIGTSAINVGLLCSGPIIPLSYSLSKKKALEMLLSGDMIDAVEAERLGIINRVVPLEKLNEETRAFAGKFIDKSSVAVRLGKKFYYEMMDMTFRQKFALADEVFARLCMTDDAREGVRAFLEKRKPEWKGR